MLTTTDHQERAEPGGCRGCCSPLSYCPACMGELQRQRYRWEMKRWVERWGNTPSPVQTPRRRPVLRVVK